MCAWAPPHQRTGGGRRRTSTLFSWQEAKAGWRKRERERTEERGGNLPWSGGGGNTDSIAVLMPCPDDAVSPTGPDCRKFPLRPDSPAPSVRPPLFAAVARAADGGGG